MEPSGISRLWFVRFFNPLDADHLFLPLFFERMVWRPVASDWLPPPGGDKHKCNALIILIRLDGRNKKRKKTEIRLPTQHPLLDWSVRLFPLCFCVCVGAPTLRLVASGRSWGVGGRQSWHWDVVGGVNQWGRG